MLLLLVLAHCALIWLIASSHAEKVKSHPALQSIALILIERQTRLETADVSHAASPPRITAPTIRADAPPMVAPLNFPNADTPSSNAITDWYGQQQAAAESALEMARARAGKATFGHKMPAPATAPDESIFDPSPVHHAHTWDGPDRIYISDDCYYQYDPAASMPQTGLDHRLKTPVCKAPPKGGGDKMFKNLRPEYLKKGEGKSTP